MCWVPLFAAVRAGGGEHVGLLRPILQGHRNDMPEFAIRQIKLRNWFLRDQSVLRPSRRINWQFLLTVSKSSGHDHAFLSLLSGLSHCAKFARPRFRALSGTTFPTMKVSRQQTRTGTETGVNPTVTTPNRCTEQ